MRTTGVVPAGHRDMAVEQRVQALQAIAARVERLEVAPEVLGRPGPALLGVVDLVVLEDHHAARARWAASVRRLGRRRQEADDQARPPVAGRSATTVAAGSYWATLIGPAARPWRERGRRVVVTRVPQHPAGAARLLGAPDLGRDLGHAEDAPVERVVLEVLQPRPHLHRRCRWRACGSAARSRGRPCPASAPGCGRPGCPCGSRRGRPWGRCSRGAARAPRCAGRCRCRSR